MLIPQCQEDEIPMKGILKNKLNTQEGSPIDLHLEKNLENFIVQIFAKKEPNLKRRKINLFKNNDYLPD